MRQAIQILTTEHFNLQSARSATVSEAIDRLSGFLQNPHSWEPQEQYPGPWRNGLPF